MESVRQDISGQTASWPGSYAMAQGTETWITPSTGSFSKELPQTRYSARRWEFVAGSRRALTG